MSNETNMTPSLRPVTGWTRAALCIAVALPFATLAACSKKTDDSATGAASAAYVAPAPAPATMPSSDASMPDTGASMPDSGASAPATAASDPMSAMPAASTASMP